MNLFGLAQRIEQAKFLLNDHAPTILTGVGVAGTVTTAYLTGRATFKAAKLIEQESKIHTVSPDNLDESAKIIELDVELSKTQKARLVWKFYIPPVGTGLITVTSIIAANKISSKKIAALGVAAGISERALQEYKDKMLEKLGKKQDQTARDEIAQERVDRYPMNSREVILAGTGQVLCYDMHTGRYFQSSVEDIKRAENKVNHELINYMHASASEFYDEIGLPPSTKTDSVGWNVNNRIEVTFSSVLMNDKPCLAIDFVHPPTSEYARHHD